MVLVVLAVGVAALVGLAVVVNVVSYVATMHWAVQVGAATLLLAVSGFGLALRIRHLRKRAEVAASHAAAAAEEQQRSLAFALEAHQRDVERREREETERRAEQQRVREERWRYLCECFGEDIATSIWQRRLWIGAPEEAVTEMLGPPLDVREKVLKKCVRRNLRYIQVAKNRYALKIDVEDGFVTGWEGQPEQLVDAAV